MRLHVRTRESRACPLLRCTRPGKWNARARVADRAASCIAAARTVQHRATPQRAPCIAAVQRRSAHRAPRNERCRARSTFRPEASDEPELEVGDFADMPDGVRVAVEAFVWAQTEGATVRAAEVAEGEPAMSAEVAEGEQAMSAEVAEGEPAMSAAEVDEGEKDMSEAEVDEWEQAATSATAAAAATLQQPVRPRVIDIAIPTPSIPVTIDEAIERNEVVCSPRSAAWARADPDDADAAAGRGDGSTEWVSIPPPSAELDADMEHDGADCDMEVDPDATEQSKDLTMEELNGLELVLGGGDGAIVQAQAPARPAGKVRGPGERVPGSHEGPEIL
jgi:hypothetical protein